MSTRAVYDTMLFLQAAARPARVHRSFRAVYERHVTLCLSVELLSEVRDVLTRPEMLTKFPALTPAIADAFVTDVAARGQIFAPVPKVFAWPEHPDDDHLFNLAIAAQAEYLVTWETRILKLYGGASQAGALLCRLAPHLRVVTPPELAAALASGNAGRED